jgi:hypothetical protein
MQLTTPEPPEPPVVIDPPAPPLESEVLNLSTCNGQNLELARATMTTITTARLARLRSLVADSAAQIDADLAAGRALIEGAAQAIVDGTEAVNDLASALAARAGLLRAAAGDAAVLAAAQAQLVDESALGLSAEQVGVLNIAVALLPARIEERQAAADAALPDIRSMITDGGIDLGALVAELYDSTSRVGCSFFASDQRTTRTDVEAGRYALPD